MNQITDLRQAVKDKTRINVFINNKFRFSLTLEELTDAKLKVGQELTDEEITELQTLSDFGKLYQRELEYALTRPHSEKEVRDHLKNKKFKREIAWKRYEEFEKRLKEDKEYREYVRDLRKKTREKNAERKDFTEDNRNEYTGRYKTGLPTKPGAKITTEDIEKIIAKLKKVNIINDEEFARYFAENRNRIKGTSLKKLKLELRAKGIDQRIIENTFREDPRDEKEDLLKIIEKKRRKYPDDTKLIQYLLRQGFPYDLVLDSLHETDSQN